MESNIVGEDEAEDTIFGRNLTIGDEEATSTSALNSTAMAAGEAVAGQGAAVTGDSSREAEDGVAGQAVDGATVGATHMLEGLCSSSSLKLLFKFHDLSFSYRWLYFVLN